MGTLSYMERVEQRKRFVLRLAEKDVPLFLKQLERCGNLQKTNYHSKLVSTGNELSAESIAKFLRPLKNRNNRALVTARQCLTLHFANTYISFQNKWVAICSTHLKNTILLDADVVPFARVDYFSTLLLTGRAGYFCSRIGLWKTSKLSNTASKC
ncbi:ADM_HP2_G0024760.mRNA.1.CDS.1 [Saccharomyces cerevisiae]|nr:ADM_HP2_G0024760.mRNA.1.CDS.1 [Saccharomyces cerevisiae]CAI6450491.1 ADM_HP2_G0024760.mRNA.1.CDS.1 [Saccharomyces cerevisiae]